MQSRPSREPVAAGRTGWRHRFAQTPTQPPAPRRSRGRNGCIGTTPSSEPARASEFAYVRACAGRDRHDRFRFWTHSPFTAEKPREQSRHAPPISWLELSEGSCPGDAGETAALVLAIHEFVANGGGPRRRSRRAASPARTGSRGCAGLRGWWRSKPAVRRLLIWSPRTAGTSPKRQ